MQLSTGLPSRWITASCKVTNKSLYTIENYMNEPSLEDVFKIMSRERLAQNPKILVGLMMDLGFRDADVFMVRAAFSKLPSVMSGLLRGEFSPEGAARMIAERTGIDKARLTALLSPCRLDYAPSGQGLNIRCSELYRWC